MEHYTQKFDLETQELIDNLEASGFKDLLDAIMYGDGTYNAKGRINKSALCRTLGIKSAQLEEQMYHLRAASGDVLESPPAMPIALQAKAESAAKQQAKKEQPKKPLPKKPPAKKTVNHIIYRFSHDDTIKARREVPWQKGQLDEQGQVCSKVLTTVNDNQAVVTVYFNQAQ